MFAAASGARLAHRHNKAVKKQISAGQIEGLKVQYKGFQKQQQLKYSGPNGNKFPGVPHRRPNYSTNLYSDPNLKLSSGYIDINGRIAKLGHVDFEGKSAWQEREQNHNLEPRVSICVPNEAAVTHRTKQREAHSRWVKRNRIHDLSFGDCSSDEDLFYGVQNGAANLLLYVGLGTTCVGMIIAFVGTGEKGFKTMELRLIGPSLIGAGVLIIIFRIMLCVCPSKCLKLKKHKLKNSTNKLNSEETRGSQEMNSLKEPLRGSDKAAKSDDRKKCVSIAILPTTSGLSTKSLEAQKTFEENAENPSPFIVPTISYLESEKPDSSSRKLSDPGNSGEEKEKVKTNHLKGSCPEVTSSGSEGSDGMNTSKLIETFVSPENSDVSMTSLINISPPHREPPRQAEAKEEVKISKFELSRNPKNLVPSGVVLNPSSLTHIQDTE